MVVLEYAPVLSDHLQSHVTRPVILGSEIFMEYCEWAVREGYENTFWGNTPCKKGFNYLSKTKRVSDLKDCYENRKCPICGKPIKLKGYLFEEEENE